MFVFAEAVVFGHKFIDYQLGIVYGRVCSACSRGRTITDLDYLRSRLCPTHNWFEFNNNRPYRKTRLYITALSPRLAAQHTPPSIGINRLLRVNINLQRT